MGARLRASSTGERVQVDSIRPYEVPGSNPGRGVNGAQMTPHSLEGEPGPRHQIVRRISCDNSVQRSPNVRLSDEHLPQRHL